METKIKVSMGYTNPNKGIKSGKFHKVKEKNEFNHKINYNILEKFDFAPKVFENSKHLLVTKKIEGNIIKDFSNKDLIQIGKNMRILHSSNANFPQFNLRRRIKAYKNKMNKGGKKIPFIEDNYNEMMKLVSRMNHLNPVHNDLGGQNILKDKEGKIGFVDGEYATRGDKHFDIAFFIESCKLNEEQEEILIKSYESIDGIKVIQEGLPLYKKFVHGISVCWAYAQDPIELPFDVNGMIERFEQITKLNNKNK